MALITKPDMEFIWASGGAIVEPSDVKKQTGWTPEVPPHQWENWIQNRQDQMLAHINQRGIPAWDGNTNYEAGGLSYVQGSDGKVYKSVVASGPAGVVQNPTTDVSNTYWLIAFAPLISPAFTGTPTAPTPSIGTRSTAIATMQNFANEFGATLSSSGYQKLPSGMIIQWGFATVPHNTLNYPITLPIAFPNAHLHAVGSPGPLITLNVVDRNVGIGPSTLSDLVCTVQSTITGSTGVYFTAIGY